MVHPNLTKNTLYQTFSTTFGTDLPLELILVANTREFLDPLRIKVAVLSGPFGSFAIKLH